MSERPDDTIDATVEALLREISGDDFLLEAPPESVWAGIVSSLATEPAPVAHLDDRRASHSQRGAWLMAVAAAAVLIIGAVVVTRPDNDGPTEVATASLAHDGADPGFVAMGEGRSAAATLLAEGDDRLLRLDDADLPAMDDDADLELWLIAVSDDEIVEIQTLGVIEDGDTYTVPSDFDPDAFDAVAVDISIEPRDGDEAHSGQSLVRGPLTEA